ncbi:mucin [Talaromyces pinophilus]|uniref:Mucin n=1 Tax=Talaromyces pinophilus TaxID=128442 RepID=A0A0B8N2W0_TALPI|nr:mucin [Talaromyces pinophilus]
MENPVRIRFATQITCFLCHETLSKLAAIECSIPQESVLAPKSFPTPDFQQRVSVVLATFHISDNVIAFALLLIYRLKKSDTPLDRKIATEFHLIALALMVGSKGKTMKVTLNRLASAYVNGPVIDDIHYPNKAWAQVIGTAPEDIHSMEIGFLKRIQYALFVSEKSWSQWRSSLDRFVKFIVQASSCGPCMLRGHLCDIGSSLAPACTNCYRDNTLCMAYDKQYIIHQLETEARSAAIWKYNMSVRVSDLEFDTRRLAAHGRVQTLMQMISELRGCVDTLQARVRELEDAEV